MWYSNSLPKCLVKLCTGSEAGITEGADGASHDVIEHAVEEVEVFRTSLAMLDAVKTLVQPRGTFTAGRALTAGFLVIEERGLQRPTMQVVSSITITAPEPSIGAGLADRS